MVEQIKKAPDDELGELAKRAVKIAETLPDKFQEKCFEVLLNAFLARKLPAQEFPSKDVKKGAAELPPAFIVPIDIKAFLQQYNVAEENLSKLFLMHGNDIRPTYKLKTTKKANAQIRIALLTALETALKGGKFEFGMEDIRARCKDSHCYDAGNFKPNFKKKDTLFKSLTDEEHIGLSPDGKAELAETIAEIAK